MKNNKFIVLGIPTGLCYRIPLGIVLLIFFFCLLIFSAIPDSDWKKEQQSFLDSYNKAKSASERAIAIRKLVEVDHPGVVKVLTGTVLPRELKENELLLVDLIITSLGKLTDQAAIDEIITATKKAVLPDKIILIQVLGKISSPESQVLLLELLKSSDTLVKISALDALAESSPPEAFNFALEALNAKVWELQVSAINFLGKIKDEENRKKALEMLRKKLPEAKGRIKNDISEVINNMVQAGNAPAEGDKTGGTYSFFDIPLEGDVVFVVDISKSMDGKNKDGITRWQKLVHELEQSLEEMAKSKQAVKFNIIAYSEKIRKFQNSLVPDTENKDAAFKWVDGLKPGSLGDYTNIYDAVEMSLVGQSATAQGGKIVITGGSGVPNPYSICLMTDGKANRGKYKEKDDILTALRVLNQTRKIKINTIALDLGVQEAQGAGGMGAMYAVDPELMEMIAKEHNGTFKKF